MDGDCECSNEELLPCGLTVCKHRLWARLKVQAGEFLDRLPLKLYTEGFGSQVLLGIKEGPRAARPPQPGETVAGLKERLLSEVYQEQGTVFRQDKTVEWIYL